MNHKILTFLIADLVQQGQTDKHFGALTSLVLSSDEGIAKAIEDHRPVITARVEKAKADLAAKVADADMILAEIKQD